MAKNALLDKGTVDRMIPVGFSMLPGIRKKMGWGWFTASTVALVGSIYALDRLRRTRRFHTDELQEEREELND